MTRCSKWFTSYTPTLQRLYLAVAQELIIGSVGVKTALFSVSNAAN